MSDFGSASPRTNSCLGFLINGRHGLLASGTFQGFDVLRDAPLSDPDVEHIHNACQCAWRRRRSGPARVDLKFGPWSCKAPPWCANGGPLMRQQDFSISRDPSEFGIKVQRDKMKSPARIACKVFGRSIHAIRQVRFALGEAIALLDSLHNGFSNYAGDRGVERHLQNLWQCHMKAFDFKEWVAAGDAPSNLRNDAFQQLWVHLWCDLSKTFFPDQRSSHNDVLHRWPRQPPLSQYHCLCVHEVLPSWGAKHDLGFLALSSGLRWNKHMNSGMQHCSVESLTSTTASSCWGEGHS